MPNITTEYNQNYSFITPHAFQSGPSVARLLIVDSDSCYRALLRQCLSRYGAMIDAAENQDTFYDLLAQTSYDLLIIDIHSEGFEGVDLLDYLSQQYPNLSLLVLAQKKTVVCTMAALRARVVDFLQKPIPAEEAAKRVQELLQSANVDKTRQQAIYLLNEAIALLHYTTNAPVAPAYLAASQDKQDEHVDQNHGKNMGSHNGYNHNGHKDHCKNDKVIHIQAGILTLDREKRLAILEGKPPQTFELTEGEASILDILITQSDRVLSCRQLAHAICEYDLEELEAQSLVRPYIFRLRHKLESSPNHPQLIRTVRGRGYLLAPIS